MPAKAPVSLDNFASDDVRDRLNQMTIGELIAVLGGPDEHVVYAKAAGDYWHVGDERPALANDDPAVQQAIGRCAATRRTNVKGVPFVALARTHPTDCGWCGYPVEELLKVCAWAVHQSGYIEAHTFVWTDEEGRRYARAGGDHGYRNKTHRAFWELPPRERERQIEVAAGRESLIESRKGTA